MINLHSCSWRNTNSKYCNKIWQQQNMAAD